jgi:protease-4
VARSQTRLLLVVTAIGFLIATAAVVAVVLLAQSGPPSLSDEPEWLELRLAGSIDESPGAEALLVDPADMPPLVTELTRAIRDAAESDEIAGIYVKVGPNNLGWANTQELQRALLEFQAAGKPCVAWTEQLTTKDYLLASACETVHLAPAGVVLVTGLATTRMYYAETFERYGISANFEHVGDFKSAVEPYERTSPSEAAQEANDYLLDGLYSVLIDGVAEGRRVEPEVAQGWLDDPPITPAMALEAGMVDALSYADEARDSLGEDLTLRKQKDWLRERRSDWSGVGKGIAVIYAEGAIIDGKSSQDFFGSRYIGHRTVVSQLRKARQDEDVAAVVLRVNSPGGSGSASDAIWREVVRTKAEKPVVVSMGDYAASGGYYISMAADHIYAEPGTLTGSIGVFGGKLNMAGLYEEFGVHLHTDQRGAYANMLSGTSDFNEAEREKFRAFLAGFYDVFITKAAEGREMDKEALHAVAQGRVWTGAQALERDLVDELGGLDHAIAKAASLAELESYAIERVPQRKGLVDQIMEELSNPGGDDESLQSRWLRSASPPLPRGAQDSLSGLVRLETVLAGTSVVAMLPGDLSVR